MDLDTIYKNVMSQEAILIDVREKDEWDMGHIEGALHIPLSAIEKDIIGTFPSSISEKTVYIYCARGGRAHYVAQNLQWGKHESNKNIIPLSWGFQDLKSHKFTHTAL